MALASGCGSSLVLTSLRNGAYLRITSEIDASAKSLEDNGYPSRLGEQFIMRGDPACRICDTPVLATLCSRRAIRRPRGEPLAAGTRGGSGGRNRFGRIYIGGSGSNDPRRE